jgi:hypothetical protein
MRRVRKRSRFNAYRISYRKVVSPFPGHALASLLSSGGSTCGRDARLITDEPTQHACHSHSAQENKRDEGEFVIRALP